MQSTQRETNLTTLAHLCYQQHCLGLNRISEIARTTQLPTSEVERIFTVFRAQRIRAEQR
jgi:hypothetical protein